MLNSEAVKFVDNSLFLFKLSDSERTEWTIEQDKFSRNNIFEDCLKEDFYAQMCRIERWSTRTLRSTNPGNRIYIVSDIIDIGEIMAISEIEVMDFIRNKEVKLIGDRLITIPKMKEKRFFKVEMDVPEEEIDELLNNEVPNG